MMLPIFKDLVGDPLSVFLWQFFEMSLGVLRILLGACFGGVGVY